MLVTYECKQCGTTQEVLVPAEDIPTTCLKCGAEDMHRAWYTDVPQVRGDTTVGSKLP